MSDPRIRRGLALLDAGEWFDAHEALEHPWRESTGTRRLFLQALIHGSVALEHLRRGNTRGAWGQWQKARDKAARSPESMDGVQLHAWMADLDAFFAAVGLGPHHVSSALPPPDTWPRPPLAAATAGLAPPAVEPGA